MKGITMQFGGSQASCRKARCQLLKHEQKDIANCIQAAFALVCITLLLPDINSPTNGRYQSKLQLLQ